MPIRVRCTNPQCNKLLNVPDKLAGKACRCPGCKTELRVPAEEIVTAVELVDEAAISEKPQPVHKAVLPGTAPHPRRREEDEEEDEEELDLPKRKKPVARITGAPLNIILFSVGICLLLALALVVFFPWVSLSLEIGPKKDPGSITVTGMGYASMSMNPSGGANPITKSDTLSSDSRPEGLLFLILVVVVGLGVVIAAVLALLNVFGDKTSWTVASITSLVAEAASIMFLVWLLAWIWKAISLSDLIRNFFERQPGVGATISTFPGLGIFIGIGLAVGAAYVFSMLSGRFTKKAYSYLADLTGLLLGGAILGLVVRAWDAQKLFDGIMGLR